MTNLRKEVGQKRIVTYSVKTRTQDPMMFQPGAATLAACIPLAVLYLLLQA